MTSVGLVNYGENRPASGVGTSLVPGKEGGLTYLVDGHTVVSASYDYASGKIVRETILNLALGENDFGVETVTDLFVFDDMVTARMNDNTFKFFPYPLVAMNYVSELAFGDDENVS